MARYALAADIGGTNIRVAKVSASGRLTYRSQAATPHRGGQAVVALLVTLLERIPRTGVEAVGVDVPGLAYPSGEVWAPNIPGWKRMSLRNRLQERLGLPVVIESDRNAFVVGEAWKGAGRGSRNMIFLAIGTGVGAGILVDGRLVRGEDQLAGSIGWMAVRDKFMSRYARCGCLESHASGSGIGAAASRCFRRKMTSRETAQLAAIGSRRAQLVRRDAARYLGLAVANLISTLNPEVIVFGGGVMENCGDLLAETRKTMLRWAQPIAARRTKLVCSRLGDTASLLGAARLAFESQKLHAAGNGR